jgi:hypothetical protein
MRHYQTKSAALDKALADFLSGTKGTAEESLPWAVRESGGRRTGNLNVETAVEQAFAKDDWFHKIYAISSAAMHGRSQRSLELLERGNSQTPSAPLLGVIVLERLASLDERLGVIAPAIDLVAAFDHVAALGGSSGMQKEIQLKQAFGVADGSKLKEDRDYTGVGTRHVPFRFRRHLQFRLASKALLNQLGVINAKRRLDNSADGKLCDCYIASDREWWFEIPAA